jgi:hypothetical protein
MVCLVCEDLKDLEGHLRVHRGHQESTQNLISKTVTEIINLPSYTRDDTAAVERHHALLFKLSYHKWQREINESSFRTSYNLLRVTCVCRSAFPDTQCNCYHCTLKCANDMSYIENPL